MGILFKPIRFEHLHTNVSGWTEHADSPGKGGGLAVFGDWKRKRRFNVIGVIHNDFRYDISRALSKR